MVPGRRTAAHEAHDANSATEVCVPMLISALETLAMCHVRDTPRIHRQSDTQVTASGMKRGSREHESERHAVAQRARAPAPAATVARHALHTLVPTHTHRPLPRPLPDFSLGPVGHP